MKESSWDKFFSEKAKAVLSPGTKVLDIGGGLRAVKGKGNRFDPKRSWLARFVRNTDYKVMDPVPDFNPEIVGDIHAIPLPDNSIDGLFCLAVLEHVENPFKAVDEMYRVMKLGGKALVYVPFLYYYHAEVGYYKDFWRYSRDAVNLLFSKYKFLEVSPVRGAIETLTNLSPGGKNKLIATLSRFLDKIFKKDVTNQVSGFYIYVEK